jgi:predicted O-methyltransferase YrrM
MKILRRLCSYCITRFTYKNKLSDFLGVKPEETAKLYKEINSSDLMCDIAVRTGARRGFFGFNMCMVLRAPTLYCLCRLLKPDVVVETGVADGFSSAFILCALEANNKGRLYSIDLPNQIGQEIKGGRQTGWLVPENLLDRWELLLGDSKIELPKLSARLKNIDIFYHDSDHSYENMTFEFNVVFPFVIKNGLIVSDDITDNGAFDDFCNSKNIKSVRLFKTGVAKTNA